MWTCPKCRRKFVSKNSWHSCTSFTADDFLAKKGPKARRLFLAFDRLAKRSGPGVVASPAKTRIAYMGRVRFAGVSSVSDKGMTISFALPGARESARFSRVRQLVPGWYGHYLRVTSVEDMDAELLGWLKESYHEMGMQRRLKSRRRSGAPPRSR